MADIPSSHRIDNSQLWLPPEAVEPLVVPPQAEVRLRSFEEVKATVGELALRLAHPLNTDYDTPFKPRLLDQLDRAYDSLEELHDRDPTAYYCTHCLRVGVLGVAITPFTGADKGQVLVAGVAHDPGKGRIDEGVLERSIHGGYNPAQDQPEMDTHQRHSFEMAKERGIDEPIAVGVCIHHGKQRRPVPLAISRSMITPEAQGISDTVAGADTFDARMNRNDEHSASLDSTQRDEQARLDLAFILGDYGPSPDKPEARLQYAEKILRVLKQQNRIFWEIILI
jgi:hypothetical protein